MSASVDFGDVPTWAGVFTSLLTLGAAVLAWRVTRRGLQLEFERDLERADEARREQASKVSAWIAQSEPISHSESVGVVSWGGAWTVTGVQVRNGSAEPIYQVELALWSDGELRGTHKLSGLTPPGEHFESIPDDVYQYIEQDQDGDDQLVSDLNRSFLVEIRFTDARGRRWRRAKDGQLHHLEPSPDLRS